VQPVSNTISDVQVCLNRLRDGDAEAAKEVVGLAFERLREKAHKILRRGDPVRNQLEPTALVCDAYEAIVRAVIATEPPSYDDFFWLATRKLRQKLLDHVRVTMRERLRMSRGPQPVLAGGGTSPGTGAARGEFLEGMAKHVAELKLEHRRILYYMDVVGLTQKETAERLQKDESTVKRGYRALKPELFDLMAKYLLGRGLPSLSDEEKRQGYDIAKAAALDSLWGECQAELDALSPEDARLIDLHLCWDGPEAENAERLQMDLETFRAKREELTARLSPMIQDLLKK
jgi:DNA-directed RNA polymerase specialized sigma24 family protein